MNNKCIVFTFNFPPRIGGESLVTYKLLNNSKYNYDVISSTYSKTLVSDLITRDGITVYNSVSGIGWVFFAIKQYLKLKHDYCCMMSRSMPVLSHVPALFVKYAHPKMKWIASISDPIYNTPYRVTTTVHSKILAWAEDHIEKRVYKRADQLIFTNEYMMKYILQGKYEKYRNKATVIGFGYDESISPIENNDVDELLKIIHGEHNSRVIAHVGAMYGERNADILIEGYKKYLLEKPSCDTTIEILFLGTSKKNLIDEINKANLQDYIHVISTVPYEESLYCMSKVDGLFLIDAEFEQISTSIFLPSKAYDYIYAQKPITVFGRNTGPVIDLLKGTGALNYAYSVEGVKECLLTIGRSEQRPCYKNIEEYSVRKSSERLDEIITELINE